MAAYPVLIPVYIMRYAVHDSDPTNSNEAIVVVDASRQKVNVIVLCSTLTWI